MKLQVEVKGTTNIKISEDIKVVGSKFSHLHNINSGESLSDKVFDNEYENACKLYGEGEVEIIIEEIKVLKCVSSKKWIKNDTPV